MPPSWLDVSHLPIVKETEAEQRIRQAVRHRRAESVALLARLIAEESIAGSPTRLDELLRGELLALGLQVETFRANLTQLAGHPEFSPPLLGADSPPANLFARRSGDAGRTLLLFAHIDTEAVGDLSQWTVPPFGAITQGTRMYGLGAADDKAGVVSIIEALKALREADMELSGGLNILLVHGKQGGALGTLPGMSFVRKANSAVYSHPAESGAGLDQIKVASRGIFSFQVEIQGHTPEPTEIRTPASADPRTGVNAIDLGLRLLAAIEDWQAAGASDGRVVSVNTFNAGGNPLQVPDRCILKGTVWFDSGTIREHAEDLGQAIASQGGSEPWLRDRPPRFGLIGIRANPAHTDPRSALVGLVSDVLASEHGRVPRAYAWHAASDIRFPILCHGIPAVGIGALGGNFYGPDEWVDLESMHTATAILARLIQRLAG
jgi:acetylornithine deacetylase